MGASTIGGVNLLSEHEKREIYRRVIPQELFERFKLNPYLVDKNGNSLISLKCKPGSTSVELSLYHEFGFRDPILYGHLTDTMNGQIHRDPLRHLPPQFGCRAERPRVRLGSGANTEWLGSADFCHPHL